MLICGKRSRHKDEVLHVTIGGDQVECVKEMKYLGVIVDRFLMFEPHVMKVCAKLSSRTGLLGMTIY